MSAWPRSGHANAMALLQATEALTYPATPRKRRLSGKETIAMRVGKSKMAKPNSTSPMTPSPRLDGLYVRTSVPTTVMPSTGIERRRARVPQPQNA